MEKKTFAAACSAYFGRKSNQSMSEFSAELKQLTPEDREYFIKEFARIGIEITA